MVEEKMMDRVQKLLERANHERTTPAERDACMQKADALMLQHSISEHMLRQRAGERNKKEEPIVEKMVFINRINEYYSPMSAVSMSFARLAQVRIIISGLEELSVLGYADDIQYFRALWIGAFMTFTSKLYPRWDDSLTLAANIKRQKDAGVKWGEIYDLALQNGWSGYRRPGKVDVMTPVVGLDANTFAGDIEDPTYLLPIPVKRCPEDKGYFKRLYEKQCTLEGVEHTNHTQRNAAYRESYAYGFCDEIHVRVSAMLASRQGTIRQTTGAELALRDKSTILDDTYALLFPGATKSKIEFKRYGTEMQGSHAGHSAGRQVDLGGGRTNIDRNNRELSS